MGEKLLLKLTGEGPSLAALWPPDFESGASASSATAARRILNKAACAEGMGSAKPFVGSNPTRASNWLPVSQAAHTPGYKGRGFNRGTADHGEGNG